MSIIEDVFIASEQALRQFVLEILPCEPHNITEIRSKPIFELLIVFLDWQKRLVPARPRNVHCSTILKCNQFSWDPLFGADFEGIKSDIESGKSLLPYINTPKNIVQSLDLLLNDWGIHHLHLSATETTGPLLFAAFKDNDAYLIDILSHGKWVHDSLCKIMVREWPEAELLYEMPDLTGQTLSNEERLKYRNLHINVCVDIDGKAYFPRGLMSDGNSLDSFSKARRILNDIHNGKGVIFTSIISE